MREIKFKAKRVSDGEWVESTSIQNNPFGKTYLMDAKRLVECYNKEVMPFNIWVEVDPSTLCQFTGLCDRNGKEIYEGDIVKHKSSSYENPLEVEWICDYACVGFIDKTDFNTPYFMQKIDEPKLIVIGNIHSK